MIRSGGTSSFIGECLCNLCFKQGLEVQFKVTFVFTFSAKIFYFFQHKQMLSDLSFNIHTEMYSLQRTVIIPALVPAIYRPINIKSHNLHSYFLFSKKFSKCFILSPAFYLIMWLMKSPKNF